MQHAANKMEPPSTPTFIFEDAVEIMPLGIQIVQSTRRRQKYSKIDHTKIDHCTTQRLKCQFIPRELIYDVVITEVVSFLDVQNCICFRVLIPQTTEEDTSVSIWEYDREKTITALMKERKI